MHWVDSMRANQKFEPGEAQPAWLEVFMEVDGELAEAVAEVLARYAPDGVVIHSTEIEQNELDEGQTRGPLRVSAYLPVNSQLESTRSKLEQALWYLGRIMPLPAPAYTAVHQQDWSQSWKTHYRPVEIGERLVIQPPWIEDVPADRLAVLIEPGMAFGTGTHPTTRLCLELLETHLQPGIEVFDVGCGSGILSIAALKLGASKVVGVDTDVAALENARQNARLNGVDQGFETRSGSIEVLRKQRAPLVLVNILAAVIVKLLDQGLAELIAPEGYLVLSGILETQLEGQQGYVSVLEALRRHDLRVVEKRQIQDWVALVVQR